MMRKKYGKSVYSNTGMAEYQASIDTLHADDGLSGCEKSFVAIDSEGVSTGDGRHHLILVAASTGEYIVAKSGAIGITRDEVLAWLLTLADNHPNSIFIIFGGSYDVNMWLQGTMRHAISNIWRWGPRAAITLPLPLLDDGKPIYAIKYMPRKKVTIYDFSEHPIYRPSKDNPIDESVVIPKQPKKGVNYTRSITIQDVSSYWQCSFLKALTVTIPDYNEHELARIEAGKKERSFFTVDQLPEILLYTQAELRALVRMMDILRGGIYRAGYRPLAWYGPGPVARAVLRAHRVPKSANPAEVEAIALHAFFGGRIELIRYGDIKGPIYNYDINSAYPDVVKDLPDLTRGEWHHSTTSEIYGADIACYHISFVCRITDDKPFGAFPYRDSKGSVFFPVSGTGWYWQPEVLAAVDSGVDIMVHASYRWIPSPDHNPPFVWMEALYAKRLVAKLEGSNGLQLALKLVMNSIYGKLAQSRGVNPLKGTGYTNFVLAGLITSTTRARLYRTACMFPGSVVAFATDGVYMLKALELNLSNTVLGAWTETVYDAITIVQAGVYWIKKTSSEIGLGTWQMKCRGIIMPTEDDDIIRYRAIALNGLLAGLASVTYPARKFIGMGAALAAKDFRCWCTWQNETKEIQLSIDGTKRKEKLDNRERVRLLLKREAMPTEPATCVPADMGVMSFPYTPKWLTEEDLWPEDTLCYDNAYLGD